MLLTPTLPENYVSIAFDPNHAFNAFRDMASSRSCLHAHASNSKNISRSKHSFGIDFDSTASSEKENLSSSAYLVFNYYPASSFSSQIYNHHNEETSTESTDFNLTSETKDIMLSSETSRLSSCSPFNSSFQSSFEPKFIHLMNSRFESK